MRKLVLSSLASAFIAACGGSSHNSGGPTPVSGTVGGRAFSPVDVQAIEAGSGSTPCTVPVLGTVGIKAVAILVTSYGNSCGDFATSECKFHQNAQSVTILFARLSSGPEPALAPGTFTVTDNPAIPSSDASGLYVAWAQALSTNATCVPSTNNPSSSVRGGTLRLDQVTGPITGHVDVTFADGSSLKGDFSAPICAGVTPDVCSIAASATPQLCTLPPTCLP